MNEVNNISRSFADNVNYLAELDKQYYKNGFIKRSGIQLGTQEYFGKVTMNVFDKSQKKHIVSDIISGSVVGNSGLEQFLLDMKTSIETLYSDVVVDVVVSDGTGAIVDKNINITLSSTNTIMGLIQIDISLIINGIVSDYTKYSILSSSNEYIAILPYLSTIDDDFNTSILSIVELSNEIKIVSDNSANITSVANTVVPNINEILLTDARAIEAASSAFSANESMIIANASKDSAIASAMLSDASRIAAELSESNSKASELNSLEYKDISLSSSISANESKIIAVSKALEASSSATTSVAKASEASSSASEAGISATNALVSENKAEKWATETEDVEVEPGKYSAMHWALKAEEFGIENASEVVYDNATSGLVADNVQEAVDEIAANVNQDVTTNGNPNFNSINLNSGGSEGTMSWDEEHETVSLIMGGGVVQQVGEELYNSKRTYNNTGSVIPNGTPVFVSSIDNVNERIHIAPMIADSSSDAYKYIGITTEDIGINSFGRVTYYGMVNGLDTSAIPVMSNVYVSDVTSGQFTTTKPMSPSKVVLVGYCYKQHATEGTIVVRHNFIPNPTEITFDNTESGLVASNVKSALDELQATKASVDMLASNITLYPTTAASNIGGYLRMVSSVDDADYNDTAVAIATGAITTTNQLIASLAADAGLFIGNPGVISITTIGNIRQTAGDANDWGEFFFRVYHRTSAGVENLIGTSSTTGPIDPVVQNQWMQFSASCLINNGVFVATDRIVIKYYANVLSSNDAQYDFQFGGSNPVRTQIPVPVSVIPSDAAEDILVDTSLFNGVLSGTDDDVQSALETIDDNVYTKSEIDTVINNLDSAIDVEKGRIDSILVGAGADIDTFAEVVALVNSIDTTNDQAFAGYVLSNDARSATIEGDISALESNKADKSTTLNGYGILDAYTKTEINTSLDLKVDKSSGKGLSTEDYTSIEKSKLNRIAENANNYSLPVATDTTLGGVKAGANITIDAGGVISASASSVAAATETSAGLIELATTAEAQARTDDSRAITPLKLFNSLKGSNQNLSASGYQKLHGGLIIQWGTYSGVLGHTSSYTPIFPIAFPNACVKVLTQYGNTTVSTNSGAGYAKIEARGNSSFTFQWGWYSGGSAQVDVDYIAIGY